MDKLPCLNCDKDCEAKDWLNRAMILHKAGVPVTKINLPCPKNKVTYQVDIRGR